MAACAFSYLCIAQGSNPSYFAGFGDSDWKGFKRGEGFGLWDSTFVVVWKLVV